MLDQISLGKSLIGTKIGETTITSLTISMNGCKVTIMDNLGHYHAVSDLDKDLANKLFISRDDFFKLLGKPLMTRNNRVVIMTKAVAYATIVNTDRLINL